MQAMTFYENSLGFWLFFNTALTWKPCWTFKKSLLAYYVFLWLFLWIFILKIHTKWKKSFQALFIWSEHYTIWVGYIARSVIYILRRIYVLSCIFKTSILLILIEHICTNPTTKEASFIGIISALKTKYSICKRI